jgi:hypothetical protein
MGYGVWCMVYGVWGMVYGVWCMGYGVWCMGMYCTSDSSRTRPIPSSIKPKRLDACEGPFLGEECGGVWCERGVRGGGGGE